jgi:hypothetical protein
VPSISAEPQAAGKGPAEIKKKCTEGEAIRRQAQQLAGRGFFPHYRRKVHNEKGADDFRFAVQGSDSAAAVAIAQNTSARTSDGMSAAAEDPPMRITATVSMRAELRRRARPHAEIKKECAEGETQ